MNIEIAILRERVTKLTQLLAGSGITVTQRGTQACVKFDRKGRPQSVNLPYIPDTASAELIAAIEGFLDHEVGHLLFTDFAIGAKAAKLGNAAHSAWNSIEDVFVERKMRERFPGSAANLKSVGEFMLREVILPGFEAAATPEEKMSWLMVPMFRAWAGQRVFVDFMADKWDMVKPFVDKIGHLKDQIAKCNSSKEALELAKVVKAALAPPLKPPEPPAPPVPPIPPEKDEEQKTDGDGAGESAGNDDADKDDQPDDGVDSQPDDADSQPAAGDEEEAPESFGEESERQDDADSEGQSDEKKQDEDGSGVGSDDEAEDDSNEDDSEGAGGPIDAGGDGESAENDAADEVDQSDSAGSGEEPESENASDEDETPTGVGTGGGDEEIEEGEEDEDAGDYPGSSGSADDDGEEEADNDQSEDGEKGEDEGPEMNLSDALGASTNFDDAVAQALSTSTADVARTADYRLYTKDFDVVEIYPLPENYVDEWLVNLEEATRHMTGVMQKDLERLMASRSTVVRSPGQRRGRVHAASLHRLATGDDRIFYKKEEHKSMETVVTLLWDNSGSMWGGGGRGGANKQKTAGTAAFALSSVLERLGIKHEVIGFTTVQEENASGFSFKMIEREEDKTGMTFSRHDPLYMPIFKGFDERLTPQVKARFAGAINTSRHMANNVDGECIEIAARRLHRQRGKRRVMIVLSDGRPNANPCGDRYEATEELEAHLLRTVNAVESHLGIECIGIGIQDASVSRFYRKHVVLNDVSALPTEVMGQLKTILLR